jgi:hypothetical protein
MGIAILAHDRDAKYPNKESSSELLIRHYRLHWV